MNTLTVDGITKLARQWRLLETAEVRALRALTAMHKEIRRVRMHNNYANHNGNNHCLVCGNVINKPSLWCRMHQPKNREHREIELGVSRA